MSMCFIPTFWTDSRLPVNPSCACIGMFHVSVFLGGFMPVCLSV